jgi:hypothetical protein
MDVGHDRHRAFAADLAQGAGAVLVGGRDADDVGPATSAAAMICSSVAFTSVVGVLVMVCTEIGASPPTGTGRP